MNTQGRLLGRYLSTVSPGELRWIGLRPARKKAMISVERVMALAELGLEGDHRSTKTPGSARQVTLISEEHIACIKSLCQLDELPPEFLRRNLLISGINLNALRHQRFKIGDALFEATAQCHPCSRMVEPLGPSGPANMLGYGGLCAKILEGGEITVGDQIIPVLES
ncbi:MOSC domain-containing protein [Pseudoteredinibacter isoporae]|uniref:MOSC domain-containing protein YiiM n=1 Tax=Pseudoteredinibacter isoporae TaxID=570281 RepID=A0A7X0JWD7_9GAMM|nr:MOSC domain-containing protein [Pseudoteredinibacter isoporae]MBB6522641.1 MOSC domain-containing protein YiiM [Pseudoteredinibacter isoporae]NHO88171.1 MOSC domain-containing protein [Pseudoteredinibacter isoporae]NIB23498.1 MOSC domain-containing protein [Pseudoteredinibacter isoporae]